MSNIIFNKEDDRHIEYNRLKMNIHIEKEGKHIFSESEFRHYIFMLGLMRFEDKVLPELTGKPYEPYYYIQGEEIKERGAVTVPAPTYTGKKIIPFPGVSLSEPVSFQDEVENFLHEMGYIN